MISHTGEHVYKCGQCSKTFPHCHNWRSHMTVHKAPGLIRCSCCKCNPFFATRGALSEHKMALQRLSCGLCGQEFPNNASRILHYKADHKDNIVRSQGQYCQVHHLQPALLSWQTMSSSTRSAGGNSVASLV